MTISKKTINDLWNPIETRMIQILNLIKPILFFINKGKPHTLKYRSIYVVVFIHKHFSSFLKTSVRATQTT